LPIKAGSRSIVLVGLMGAGKTTVGRQIAARLCLPFVDSDHEVERRTGVSVATVFEIEGEEGFRRRESAVIAEVLAGPPLVLATGGGAVLRQENRLVMKTAGLVAYIAVDPRVLYERTRHDRSRPLLQVSDPLQKLRDLYLQRDPLYREVATLVLDGNRNNARQIVDLLDQELHRCDA
jgi:shikimate kinase